MKKLSLLFAMMLFAIFANAQSLIGKWRWEDQPGNYKILEFKNATQVQVTDMGLLQDLQYDQYSVTLYSTMTYPATYRKSGNKVTFTYNYSVLKFTITDIKVYPQVSEQKKAAIKADMQRKLTSMTKQGLARAPRTDSFYLQDFESDHFYANLSDGTVANYYKEQ